MPPTTEKEMDRSYSVVMSGFRQFPMQLQLITIPIPLLLPRKIAGGDAALYSQLILQAKACIKPGLQFYQQKFSGQFHAILPIIT